MKNAWLPSVWRIKHRQKELQVRSSLCQDLLTPTNSVQFLSWKVETAFHYCWRVKSSLKLVWMNLPPLASPWLAARWSCAAGHWSDQNLFDKILFWPPVWIESPLRLRALAEKIKKATQGSLPFFGSEFTIQRRLYLCFALHILLLWSGGRCQMCPTVHIYMQLPFPCIRYIFSIFPIPHFFNHRVNRVAMAIFWRTFHHEGKIMQAWWGWEACLLPFPQSTITYKVVVFAPPISPLPPIHVLCGFNTLTTFRTWKFADRN